MNKYKQIKEKLEGIYLLAMIVIKTIPEIIETFKKIKNEVIDRRKELNEKFNNLACGIQQVEEIR